MYRPSLPKVHKQKIWRSQFVLQPLPGHCLCPNSDHRLKLTPIYQSLPLIMGQLLEQKKTRIWHTTVNLITNLQENTENSFKIRCHFLEGEPAMILESVIMEYKR